MYRFAKRMFDLISALLLFIIISPLFLFISIVVWMEMDSPVFFKQARSGMHHRPFTIIKFRTMTDAKDDAGNLLPDGERQTKVGGFLRSSSLDELPELLSIIKGDMSVIGPRPLPIIYDEYYKEYEEKRFDVRSGLIPPDAVDKSAIISWDRQFEYEANYAEHLSFRNDLKIFLKAFKIILQRGETDYGSYVREPLNVERGSE